MTKDFLQPGLEIYNPMRSILLILSDGDRILEDRVEEKRGFPRVFMSG